MSCGCNDSPFGYSPYGNLCLPDTPYPSTSPESVSSLISNLTYALYGQITKSVSNGQVVWTIPCDPKSTATILGVPRNVGEGLLCYIIRVFTSLSSTIPTTTTAGLILSSTSTIGTTQWVPNNATNLINSVVGSIPYTSGTNITSFLPPSATAGYVLSSNGAGQAPSWIQNTTVTSSTSNLLGGVSGNVPYQSGAGTTSFVSNGTAGQIFQSNGSSAPSWVTGQWATSSSLGLNPNTSGQDCSTAFQAAVNAVAATNHQTLLIQAGTYYFTKTITVPAQVKIIGESAGDRGGYTPWVSTAPTAGSVGVANAAGFGPFNFKTVLGFNGTPVTASITTVSGSNTVTVNTTGLSVGMTITAYGINSGSFIVSIGTGNIVISNPANASGGASAVFAPSALYAPLTASNIFKSFELYSINTSLTVGQAGAGLVVYNGDSTGNNSFESYPYFTGNELQVDSVYIHDFNINFLTNFISAFTIQNSNFSFARLVNLQFGCGTPTTPSQGGDGTLSNCFIGGIQTPSTSPQQYQGDGITSYGASLRILDTWIYAVTHGGNFYYSTVLFDCINTESNYSTDYFFKVWGASKVTVNGGNMAIPTAYQNTGFPVWDMTGGTGASTLILKNVTGYSSPIIESVNIGNVYVYPPTNQLEYGTYTSPYQTTGSVISGSNSITNVSSVANMATGNSIFGNGIRNSIVFAGAFVIGNIYKIVSRGSGPTDFTAIGASSNSVGTVFTATGAGSGNGAAVEYTTITNISGTGPYTLTISNKANSNASGSTTPLIYALAGSVNLVGINGSAINHGLLTPDNVLPNSLGNNNSAAYSIGSANTGFYSSTAGYINITNSGTQSWQINSTSIIGVQPNSALYAGSNTAANTPLFAFYTDSTAGIGHPATGSTSLVGGTSGTPKDILIASNNAVSLSATQGLSGTVTLSSGVASITGSGVSANSVVMLTLKTASGTASALRTAWSGVGINITGASTDNGTYNYVVLTVGT